MARARLPFSLWNTANACVFASGYCTCSVTAPEVVTVDVFDAIFPFARRSAYFRLFGRPGLVEYQVIVAPDRAESFLAELGRLLRSAGAPSVMLSMKAFAGEPRLLRFERDGVCLTLNLERNGATPGLLARLDELTHRGLRPAQHHQGLAAPVARGAGVLRGARALSPGAAPRSTPGAASGPSSPSAWSCDLRDHRRLGGRRDGRWRPRSPRPATT